MAVNLSSEDIYGGYEVNRMYKIICQPLSVHAYITILSSVLHRILYLIYCSAVLLCLLIVLYVLLELLLRATAFENKYDTYLLIVAFNNIIIQSVQ